MLTFLLRARDDVMRVHDDGLTGKQDHLDARSGLLLQHICQCDLIRLIIEGDKIRSGDGGAQVFDALAERRKISDQLLADGSRTRQYHPNRRGRQRLDQDGIGE